MHEQCSVVAKIVGDEHNDDNFNGDDLQSDISTSTSSKVSKSDPCDKGPQKYYGIE